VAPDGFVDRQHPAHDFGKVMTLLARLRSWSNWFLRRSEMERAMEAEVLFHIRSHTEELVRRGVPEAEAARQARIAFGAVESHKDAVRGHLGLLWWDELWADLRYGVRMLLRSPGFTFTAVFNLALGIGVTSAIFSVVDAVLMKPLPYQEPDRLVTIAESSAASELATRSAVAPGNYLDWRDQNRAFTELAAVHLPGFSLTGTDRPERVLGAAISAGALGMLGLRPQLGRPIAPEDDRPEASAVVMLSDSLWRRRFAARADIVGQTIRLGTSPYMVIGVLPAGLQFPQADVDLWVPLEHEITVENMRWRNSHYLDVYGRLKPGVSLAQAGEDVNRIAASIKAIHPDTNGGAGAVVVPWQADLTRDIRPALLTLLVAVGLVLVVACANVANLLLVRAIRRESEMSIRVALGAGVPRLVRQLLTESIVLTLAGGVVGLVFASWVRRALLTLRPAGLPLHNPVETNFRVLLFTLAVCVLTGIVFGLVPALRAVRADVRGALQSTSRNVTSGIGAKRLGGLLVASEIGVSLVLLIGAGLLIQSFVRLRGSDLGFRSDHTLTARISIPGDKYPDDVRVTAFCDQLLERVRSLTGVEAAGLVSFLPLTGQTFDNSFDIVGRPPLPAGKREYALVRSVDPQYFSVLGIPLVRGRPLDEHDRSKRPRAVAISETMARRYWPGGNPLGEHLVVYMGVDQSPWEIVAVVRDVRSSINAAPQSMIYFPYAQMPYRYMVLAVRTGTNEEAMVEALRTATSSIDSDQPLYQVRTLEKLIAQTLIPWRFSMTLLGVFAALALLLATAGVYGVISYAVGQRTGEIAVRMAFGAQPHEVLWPVVRGAMGVALAGIAAGLAGASELTRLLVSQLYGVDPTDWMTFAATTGLIAAVAFAASYVPARRASRVDPMVALRHE
jgi:putative ABC transport system permease protein